MQFYEVTCQAELTITIAAESEEQASSLAPAAFRHLGEDITRTEEGLEFFIFPFLQEEIAVLPVQEAEEYR